MNRRTTQALAIFVVLLAAAQLIRPNRNNPAIDPSKGLEAAVGTHDGLAAVLQRSCGDCHSNQTVWPWYTQVAPVSWLMAYGVKAGREAINFSEWASYPSGLQRSLLSASCRDASTGKMPGAYTLVRPETRLSAADIETICAAARNLHGESAEKTTNN
jgi:heme-binding protein